MSSNAAMMVTAHNRSKPETIGLSVPCGGGNFSLIVGMSFDEAPMKAPAIPAAPFVHVPICNVANHTFNAVALRWSSLTKKPNAIINTPLTVNSMCAITMPRNHATAGGGMSPTAQPTVIWRTPRIRVQRLRFAFKLLMSVPTITSQLLWVPNVSALSRGRAPKGQTPATQATEWTPVQLKNSAQFEIIDDFHIQVKWAREGPLGFEAQPNLDRHGMGATLAGMGWKLSRRRLTGIRRRTSPWEV